MRNAPGLGAITRVLRNPTLSTVVSSGCVHGRGLWCVNLCSGDGPPRASKSACARGSDLRGCNPKRQGRDGHGTANLWQCIPADRDAGTCRVLQYGHGLEIQPSVSATESATHACARFGTDLDEAGWDAFMAAASGGMMPPLSEIEGASYTRLGDICPKTCRECGPNTLTCKDGDASKLQLHHPVNQ